MNKNKKYVENSRPLRDLGIGATAGAIQAGVTLPFDKYEQLVTREIAKGNKVNSRKLLGEAFKETFGKQFKQEYLKKYPARAAKSALGMGTAWMVASQIAKKLDAKDR